MIGNVGGPGGMFDALLPLVKPQYVTYAREKAARVYISLGIPSSTGMVGTTETVQRKVALSISALNRHSLLVHGKLTLYGRLLDWVRSFRAMFYVHQTSLGIMMLVLCSGNRGPPSQTLS